MANSIPTGEDEMGRLRIVSANGNHATLLADLDKNGSYETRIEVDRVLNGEAIKISQNQITVATGANPFGALVLDKVGELKNRPSLTAQEVYDVFDRCGYTTGLPMSSLKPNAPSKS
jgi:hypothetical protein